MYCSKMKAARSQSPRTLSSDDFSPANNMSFHLNDHLLKPTAANIASMNAILEKTEKHEKSVKPIDVIVCEHLLLPTAANLASKAIVSEKNKSKDEDSLHIDRDAPVHISEHLLKPTLAQIRAQEQLHEEAERVDEKKDIWWTQR